MSVVDLIPDPGNKFLWENFRRIREKILSLEGRVSTVEVSGGGGGGVVTTSTTIAITKSITIPNPVTSDSLTLGYFESAATIRKITTSVRGTAPEAAWTLKFDADRSGVATEVLSGGHVTNNTTTGDVVTTFDNATVGANNFLWVEIGAKTGTVTELHFTIEFEDFFVTKSVTVSQPDKSIDPTLFKADGAFIVTKMVGVIRAGTEVAYKVLKGPDLSAAGTAVVTAGSSVTSTTTGDIVTVFDSDTIDYDDWLWLDITGVSGAVEEFHLTINLQRI